MFCFYNSLKCKFFHFVENVGKEEYADFKPIESLTETIPKKDDRPHLFGVGAVKTPAVIYITNNSGLTYSNSDESISHNIGIYVWGAYQVE